MVENNPTIFLSYCWANKDIADEIDNAFREIGITLTRDVRDAKYHDSLKEFMSKVRDHDFVLMLISDAYLKSFNCMKEVDEMLKERDFQERILPIVLDDASLIYNHTDLSYLQYWLDQYQKYTDKIKNIPLAARNGLQDTINHFDNINKHIAEFIEFISDQKSIPYQELKATNFKSIFGFIGVDDSSLLEELMRIRNIKDKEDQEIAIDDFILNYPQNAYGYFVKGYIKEYTQKKAAIYYYGKAILINPRLTNAFYNSAILFTKMGHYQEALKAYNQTITICPNLTEAYNNRANLFVILNRYEDAIRDLNHAIEINPHLPEAYNNRANLLIEKHCNKEALNDYNLAIHINPEFAEAYYNRGRLLATNPDRHEDAYSDYNRAIKINPQYAKAYYNRGLLLNKMGRIEEAQRDFDKAKELGYEG